VPNKPERILYLPLDIGKNVHWMRADTGAGRVVHPSHPLLADQSGYAYWQQCVCSYTRPRWSARS
jgi:hypothetical protein